jgi:hypothetical protein
MLVLDREGRSPSTPHLDDSWLAGSWDAGPKLARQGEDMGVAGLAGEALWELPVGWAEEGNARGAGLLDLAIRRVRDACQDDKW